MSEVNISVLKGVTSLLEVSLLCCRYWLVDVMAILILTLILIFLISIRIGGTGVASEFGVAFASETLVRAAVKYSCCSSVIEYLYLHVLQ